MSVRNILRSLAVTAACSVILAARCAIAAAGTDEIRNSVTIGKVRDTSLIMSSKQRSKAQMR